MVSVWLYRSYQRLRAFRLRKWTSCLVLRKSLTEKLLLLLTPEHGSVQAEFAAKSKIRE